MKGKRKRKETQWTERTTSSAIRRSYVLSKSTEDWALDSAIEMPLEWHFNILYL